MQDGCRVRGDTDPIPIFVDPGIHKPFTADVKFAGLYAFGSKYSSRDRSIFEDMHAHGFGCDLLILGVGLSYGR